MKSYENYLNGPNNVQIFFTSYFIRRIAASFDSFMIRWPILLATRYVVSDLTPGYESRVCARR